MTHRSGKTSSTRSHLRSSAFICGHVLLLALPVSLAPCIGCAKPAPAAYSVMFKDLSAPEVPHLEAVEATQATFETEASYGVFGDGWRDEEQDKSLIIDDKKVAWAASIVADLRLRILWPRDRTLVLDMQPHFLDPERVKDAAAQEVAVVWNKTRMGVCRFERNRGWTSTEFRFDVPQQAQIEGINTITFLSKYAVSPREMYGEGNDGRTHAFGLRCLTLLEKGSAAEPAPLKDPPIAFADGAIVQHAGTQIKIPVCLPRDAPCQFRIDAVEARDPAALCRVVMRNDSVDGLVTAEILPWRRVSEMPDSIEHDLGSYRGRAVEFLFEVSPGGPDTAVAWEGPKILTQAAHQTPTAPVPPSFPHVNHAVVIVLDALRADGVGCYGYSRDTTPAIDALAEQGVLFERAYAAASYTFNSTWCLLTGLYPFQHGAFGWGIRPGASRFADHFRRAGIATGFVSANICASKESGHAEGFDEYLEAFEPLAEQPGGDPSLVTAKALDFMGRHAKDRFFLYLHFRQPHCPYRATDEFFQTLSADPAQRLVAAGTDWRATANIDRKIFSREQALELRARYDENLRAVDTEIQRLIQSMKDLGLGNTLVFITADHGEAFGERNNHYTHGITVYEPVNHIPLILCADGVRDLLPQRSPTVCSNVDILPTVCEFMGVPPLESAAGESLLAKSAAAEPDRILACAQAALTNKGVLDLTRNHCNEAYWWSRYKLIRDNNDAQVELYDLAADPAEQYNLAQPFPVLTDCLRAEAAAWKAQQAARVVPPIKEPKKELIQKDEDNLRALGYL